MAEPAEVFDLLGDEYARNILAHANHEPMTALELADACDAHHSTIYRRIEQLQSFDLLDEQVRVDPDGHHATTYTTRLERISVRLRGSNYDVDLRVRDDPADRMAHMWREIRGEK